MHEKMKNEKHSEHCNASLLQIESSSKLLFLLSLPLQRLAAASAGAGSLLPSTNWLARMLYIGFLGLLQVNT